MKSTQKYVEIMEKLTGITDGTKVTFEESVYMVANINTDDLDAVVTLKSESKEVEDITLSLKELIESEDHVVEAEKGVNPFAKKDDDKKDDDEEDDKKKKKVEESDDEEDDKKKSDDDDDEEDDKKKSDDADDMDEKKKCKK